MRLFGLRILLAEDNPTNQLVARQMLESLGATVCLARDGAEALEILENQDFDAMLVDIEMPRVGGIELMRRVRASPGPRAGMPMIALTAYVMREHRAAIDAAGADGIIAKPILSVEQLGDDIRRFMHRRSPASPVVSGCPVDGADKASPVIDEGVYESLAQAIGPEAMEELLAKVEADLGSARARLPGALESGDIGEVRSASHVLISVAGAIGAVPVQERAKQLNATAHEGDLDRLRDISQRLSEDIDRVMAAVRGRLEG